MGGTAHVCANHKHSARCRGNPQPNENEEEERNNRQGTRNFDSYVCRFFHSSSFLLVVLLSPLSAVSSVLSCACHTLTRHAARRKKGRKKQPPSLTFPFFFSARGPQARVFARSLARSSSEMETTKRNLKLRDSLAFWPPPLPVAVCGGVGPEWEEKRRLRGVFAPAPSLVSPNADTTSSHKGPFPLPPKRHVSCWLVWSAWNTHIIIAHSCPKNS